MGTAEEVRTEQLTHMHHQLQQDSTSMYQQHQHQQSPQPQASYSAGQAFTGASHGPPAGWPHEKLTESDVAHTQNMDVDPSHEPSSSPSPTSSFNGNHGVFHFGERQTPPQQQHQQQQQQQQHQQQQHNYAGLVATPITRFLTKQTFGFIPKPSFPSTTDGIPPRSAPSSPLPPLSANNTIPALRLPSLSSSGSLPQSPLSSPQHSFSLPVGETLNRLFNSASLENNHSGSHSTPSSPMMLSTRGSTVTLPPFKRACLSPTTTLPPLAQQLSLEDVCRPFPYQRSMSCPSDAMVRAASFAAEEAAEDAQDAYAVPQIVPQLTDVRKYRVERSNSVDASTVLAMREAHARALHGDYHNWLDRSHVDRHPLASLAESAHAVQMMEQSRSHNLESPRSITSPSASGEDDSSNPCCAMDDEDQDYRREKKLCAFPRCSSNAVTRGLCISHGGGRRCQRKGCTRGAQSKGLCVAHGGGRICKAKGCSNIQRSMGLCIRHGGGKRCSMPGCQKGVVRQDLCTAHGGKRKCKVDDCNKHVKKKGLCRSHANSVLGASAISSPRGDMSPEYSN